MIGCARYKVWAGELIAQAGCKALVAGLHLGEVAVVFVEVDVNPFAEHDQFVDQPLRFVQKEYAPHAGSGCSLFFGVFVAFPHGDVFVGALDEEHLFIAARLFTVGKQQEHGLFLVNAAEVVQIGVLAKHKRLIAGARRLVVGIEYGETSRLHLGHKTLAVGLE